MDKYSCGYCCGVIEQTGTPEEIEAIRDETLLDENNACPICDRVWVITEDESEGSVIIELAPE